MLQYWVGPTAELPVNSRLSDPRSQTENCPPNTQQSVTSQLQPADVTTALCHPAGVEPQTPAVITGDKAAFDNCNSVQVDVDLEAVAPVELRPAPKKRGRKPKKRPEPETAVVNDVVESDRTEAEVIYPRVSSEDYDVMQPTVVVDLLPVAPAQSLVVPKKRGRKAKRRRRLATAVAGNRPLTSTEDSTANSNVSVRPETFSTNQPTFDDCNSVQPRVALEAVAPVEVRPAPKKRGRKPKKRPEPEIAVVDDVVESVETSPLAKSPRRSDGPTSVPVITEMSTDTLTTAVSADNSAPATLSTSGGNGNGSSGTPRRRGRKRKNSSLDKDDQRESKLSVDEAGVQSVWKVTSSTALEHSCNVVPRIKVTNVRLASGSTRSGSGETTDAGEREEETVVARSSSQTVGSGGRQGTLKVKSWQPIARRTDTKTTVPVLDRAREWINAVPKPSRDDWTGPVFPAREVIREGSQNGSTDKHPARDSSCLIPARSPAKNAGVQPWQSLSADANDAVGRLFKLPGTMTKKGVCVSNPPAAVDGASQLMYMIGRPDARAPPTAAISRPQSPEYGLPVNSVTGRPTICSFANDPRTGQHTTKRVCCYV